MLTIVATKKSRSTDQRGKLEKNHLVGFCLFLVLPTKKTSSKVKEGESAYKNLIGTYTLLWV